MTDLPEPTTDPTTEPDTAVAPSDGGDSPESVVRYIPKDVLARYEVFSYRNAALILSEAHPAEFGELMGALRSSRLTREIIAKPGGSQSEVPKAFSTLLRPYGWHETTIQADLLVKLLWREAGLDARSKATSLKMTRELTKARFLDGHKVDYVKGCVAFDLEWNSKDQTFDRDLYAMSAFSRCGVIDVGVLLTRSEALNGVFREMGLMTKYGASTTWMGKLLYRLNAGRSAAARFLSIAILCKGTRKRTFAGGMPPRYNGERSCGANTTKRRLATAQRRRELCVYKQPHQAVWTTAWSTARAP